MTASEEFKQAIRAGNISEAFVVAMSNAPELNITTKIVTADGSKIDVDNGRDDNSLHTHINLIEGKVENEIGEKLAGDRYAEIKQFHIQQVTQGHQTIQHNLISLQKMFQLMSSFQQEPNSRANWVDIAADVSRESISDQASATPLAGNTTNALSAGKASDERESSNESLNQVKDFARDNIEPQLPAFDDEDEEMVNDLLSLTDIDTDDRELPEASGDKADWSEWLDDEPDVNTEVFDLKSLDAGSAKENWHNWEEQNEAVSIDTPES